MSIYRTKDNQQAITRNVDLADTNVTDVIPTLNGPVSLTQVHICEHAGTGSTITIEVYDGTNSRYLTKGKTVSANDELTLSLDIQLGRGESLRATAGTAAKLHVFATFLAPPDRKYTG